MGKHYVPQRHLRRFEVRENPGFIWMYDRTKKVFKEVSISKVAQERDYYDPDIEQKLAQLVELPANIFIDKLERRERLSEEDRIQLAIYMATMSTRGPRHRRRAYAGVPEVLDNTIAEFTQRVEEWAATQNPDPALVARRFAELREAHEKFSKGPPQNIVDQIRTPMFSDRILKAILEMTWHIVTTSGPSYFVTSDSPVHVFDGFGVGRRQSELTFTISTTMALVGEHYSRPGKAYFQQATQQVVRELNRRIISHAERFIFYHKIEAWIETLAGKDLHLNQLLWT